MFQPVALTLGQKSQTCRGSFGRGGRLRQRCEEDPCYKTLTPGFGADNLEGAMARWSGRACGSGVRRFERRDVIHWRQNSNSRQEHSSQGEKWTRRAFVPTLQTGNGSPFSPCRSSGPGGGKRVGHKMLCLGSQSTQSKRGPKLALVPRQQPFIAQITDCLDIQTKQHSPRNQHGCPAYGCRNGRLIVVARWCDNGKLCVSMGAGGACTWMMRCDAAKSAAA